MIQETLQKEFLYLQHPDFVCSVCSFKAIPWPCLDELPPACASVFFGSFLAVMRMKKNKTAKTAVKDFR